MRTAEGPPQPGRHLIIWDGDCGFCARTVAWVRERDPERRFDDVPYQRAPEWMRTPERADAFRRFVHVLTQDGRWKKGGRAALFILEELGHRWLKVFELPPFVWGVELGYRLVAHNRRFFSRLLSPKRR